jgi:hypothetical protein
MPSVEWNSQHLLSSPLLDCSIADEAISCIVDLRITSGARLADCSTCEINYVTRVQLLPSTFRTLHCQQIVYTAPDVFLISFADCTSIFLSVRSRLELTLGTHVSSGGNTTRLSVHDILSNSPSTRPFLEQMWCAYSRAYPGVSSEDVA